LVPCMRPQLLAAFLAVFALGLGSGLLFFERFGEQSAITVRLGDSPTFANAVVRVYVTGAVANPGVYSLHDGDRIVDAVEAAGGPSADAATESVAFAGHIADGDTIRVPHLSEVSTTATAGPTLRAAPSEPVDINRADANLMRGLPGMTTALAASVVRSRQSDGPFASTDDLVTRKVLPLSVYDQIKNSIVASSGR
jgi:competence protein ComEA